jgi:hypothetical protein
MMLTEYLIYLMALGINNHGIIRIEDAYSVYSNKDAARSAMIRLMMWNYVETSGAPGVFVLKKAPQAAFDLAKSLRK